MVLSQSIYQHGELLQGQYARMWKIISVRLPERWIAHRSRAAREFCDRTLAHDPVASDLLGGEAPLAAIAADEAAVQAEEVRCVLAGQEGRMMCSCHEEKDYSMMDDYASGSLVYAVRIFNFQVRSPRTSQLPSPSSFTSISPS